MVEREVPATLVEVLEATTTDEKLIFTAFGTVQANRELTVHPEVSGRVVDLSSQLVVGGILKKDQMMLKIDPRDYLTNIEQEKANLEKSKFDLQLEKGRQIVAEREWQLLDPSITSTQLGEELARRKPHIREKEAALKAAESRLAKSLLDLERTVLHAPFNALVTSEAVEVGDLITPQSTVATLVATDEFRVQVSLPFNQLDWITLPSGSNPGSAVTIVQEIGAGRSLEWKAHILRLLGDVDPRSRMARMLVAIDDPLGLKNGGKDRLLIGTYVRVEIEGPLVEDVVVIPRSALRDSTRVWVMNEKGELEFREVRLIFKDQDKVFVDQGLEEGDQIVVSTIPIPIEGMNLKVRS